MPEIVVVSRNTGDEIIGVGGLLARYANNTIRFKDNERPYVIFISVGDYELSSGEYISKTSQLDKVDKVSKLLKYNWEIIWEGRQYNPPLTEDVTQEIFNKELLNRFKFLN